MKSFPSLHALLAAMVCVALLCLGLALPGQAAAAETAVPPLSAHVVDMTATLTQTQKDQLDTRLADFEAHKGSQIAVLLVATTAQETIEQYSLRVAEQWKLGRKKIDDGALLVIAKQDRVMRIEVGYGLEGALNDATSKRIISDVMTPAFKQGDYYQGISDGIDSMIRVIQGEELPAPRQPANSDDGSVQGLLPVVFIMVVIVGSILRALLGRLPGAIVTGGITAVLAWMLASTITLALLAGGMALLMTLMGISVGSFLGGGFGSGRGGSSGGFSGGGGGFGGGGASGRW